MIKITDETLMAYSDGELEDSEALSVESAIAQDPKLRERLARYQALKAVFDNGFSEVDERPLPPGLMATIYANKHPENRYTLLSRLTRFFGKTVGWQPVMATALVLFTAVVFFPSVEVPHNALPRKLIAVLDNMPDGFAENGTYIETSYVAEGEQFCRTFSNRPVLNKKGLACRTDSGTWSLIASETLPPEGSFLPAGGEGGIKTAIRKMGLVLVSDETKYLSKN